MRSPLSATPASVAGARKLDPDPFKEIFSITQTGFGLAADISRFAQARNQALLERDILIEAMNKQREQWAGAAGVPEVKRLQQRLQREIEALKANPLRLPWQDDLPAPIASSLEPYRERLEATYVLAANPFEFGKHRQEGLASSSSGAWPGPAGASATGSEAT